MDWFLCPWGEENSKETGVGIQNAIQGDATGIHHFPQPISIGNSNGECMFHQLSTDRKMEMSLLRIGNKLAHGMFENGVKQNGGYGYRKTIAITFFCFQCQPLYYYTTTSLVKSSYFSLQISETFARKLVQTSKFWHKRCFNSVDIRISRGNLACVASVSVWFQSKERLRNGILCFGRARNETGAKN